MQKIARELNLSETVFVLPPENADQTFRVRIFTPAMELPFAGHPTIGTAIVLAETGALPGGGPWNIMLGEGVGPIPVSITRTAEGLPFATLSSARMPEMVAEAPPASLLARLLGLTEGTVTAAGLPPAAYSAGVPFTIVPLASREALSAIRLDMRIWQEHVAATAARHIFAITMSNWEHGRTVHTRMFAPAMGIPEDPATGAAATALAGYLAHGQKLVNSEAAWDIHQGEDMGRPSLVRLEARTETGQLRHVRVGGHAVTVSRGTFYLVPSAFPPA